MSLRMTIGERLGITPRGTTPPGQRFNHEPPESSGVPEEVTPEVVLRLEDCSSSHTLPVISVGWWCECCQDQHFKPGECGPARVRGEMVWLHKTAPTLVIEGGRDLSPDDHNDGRRR